MDYSTLMSGLWGFVIADAMGVPVEFMTQEALKKNPVTGYRGFGSHPVPAGTRSDDTSMLLATAHSLCRGIDYDDMMQKFCAWVNDAEYTATNEVFDIGETVRHALMNYMNGKPALSCGMCAEHDNGNGSLMRILPAVYYAKYRMSEQSLSEKLAAIHQISALTHGHPRAQMACGIYAMVIFALIEHKNVSCILPALKNAKAYYEREIAFSAELPHFSRLFSPDFPGLPEDAISSSGYVVSTLEAALWCVLNTKDYLTCILKAVNLGCDTDTVAAVAGSLAGCVYAIPPELLKTIVNAAAAHTIFNTFIRSLEQ